MNVFNNLNINNVFGDSSVSSTSINFSSNNVPKNNNGLETSSGKIPSYSDLKKINKMMIISKPFQVIILLMSNKIQNQNQKLSKTPYLMVVTHQNH